MNRRISRLFYNLLLPVAVGAGYAALPFHAKLREAASGRKGWRSRWRDAGERVGARPVWFHVSSVGEFEQAKPVITSFGRTHPEVPVAVSFSSPSGYRFALRKEKPGEGNNISFIDYLPVDFARNVRYCLRLLDPRLLVFVKFDLWPNLIWEARDRGVPIALIDATLSPSSRRTTGTGRSFYRSIYESIGNILAISESDARRFRDAVPDHPSIAVTGDTRFDRVMERKQIAGYVGFDLLGEGRKIVVCGSTWPRDELRLLPALAHVMKSDPNVYAIVAPHEPHPERIAELTDWARSQGLTVGAVSGGLGDPPPRVTLIDSVGILAETYRMGDVAYIGGSFSTGVHSVIEPAIEGLPVLFGPVHDNSFEALRLIDAGAGVCVGTADDIRIHIERLLYDSDALSAAGDAARRYVESQLGATEKCVAALREYL
jgi:3-deoxy-D-manno-octulosonic-acid transferase